MYGIYQYFLTRRTAQTAAVQTTAVTGVQTAANNLSAQASAWLTQANALPLSQSAQAAQLRTQAAAAQQQAAALLSQTVTATVPPPAQPDLLATWFTQNWGLVAFALIAMAAVPALVKKL